MNLLAKHARLAVSTLLALAVSAAAQTPTIAPEVPATAPTTATAPATEPSTQIATQPSTEPAPRPPFSTTRPATTLSSRIKFNFKDAPVDDVLAYFSESLGFTIVKEGRISDRITIVAKSPEGITAAEAVEQLDSVLKPFNYTVIQTDKVLRITSRDKAKKANIPVHFGADPLLIKPTDEIITQVIPLAQVDAVRLRQDLSSMFSPDADVSANAASNTIIITDTASSIRRIVEIVSAMDHQLSSASDIRVFKLKFANAAAAAKLITDVFKPDTTSQGGSTSMRGFPGFPGFPGFGGGRSGGSGGGASATDTSGSRGGKIVASSDDRTNTVVVTGPTDTLKVIESIIAKLDADPAQDTTFFVYSLKNANAANLQSVLNGFFGNASGSVGSTNRSSTGFQPIGSSSSSMGSSGSGRSGSSSTFGNSGFGSSSSSRSTSSGSSGFSSSGRSSSSSSGGLSTAASDLVGQAYVVAEPDTNSLLVTTKTTYTDRVRELIMRLDRDVPQVLIKVLVCEVTHTNSTDIGVEYSILNQRTVTVTNADGTTSTKVVGGQAGGTDYGIAKAISTAASTGSPNGLIASVVESNLTAALRALATMGKLDVLSRPSILASDNQLASIMVGQSVPIITSSNITSVGNIVNSVTYKDLGIILNVTPHINPDGLVILDVQPTISQLSTQTVTIQAGVEAPVIDQRSAQSRVAIRNGQTIIIGGLMQDQKTETIDKIPLLGDIPYLGQLFSHTVQSKAKTELLIFITPQVASSPDLLLNMTKDEKQGLQIVPNAVGPGVFDEHMQGMNRGAAKPIPPSDSVIPLPPAPPPITPPEPNGPNQ